MSFLFPKINSKNREEALRAFGFADKSDASLDAMLRRDDVVIKDVIFSRVRGRHWQLYQSILNDPTHPYHTEAHRLLDAENAQKEAEKKAVRDKRYRAILAMRGDLNRRREMNEAIESFVKNYAMTDEEKCALGNVSSGWSARG